MKMRLKYAAEARIPEPVLEAAIALGEALEREIAGKNEVYIAWFRDPQRAGVGEHRAGEQPYLLEWQALASDQVVGWIGRELPIDDFRVHVGVVLAVVDRNGRRRADRAEAVFSVNRAGVVYFEIGRGEGVGSVWSAGRAMRAAESCFRYVSEHSRRPPPSSRLDPPYAYEPPREARRPEPTGPRGPSSSSRRSAVRGRGGMSPSQAREILGVSASAGPEEIRRAYKKRARENHPDRGGDPRAMVDVNVAKEVLDRVLGVS